jgi:hypothetical protein
MSTGALIMMIATQGTVALVAGYFFYRVLTNKPKPDNPPDEDSYVDNDPDAKTE